MLADARAGFRVHIGAAAGRDHLLFLAQEPRDHLALAGAEFRFAAQCKEFGDRHPRRFLDRMVRIDERQAKALGEPLADRGLAGPHQPHKHEMPPAKLLQKAFGRLLCHGIGRGQGFGLCHLLLCAKRQAWTPNAKSSANIHRLLSHCGEVRPALSCPSSRASCLAVIPGG